MKKLLALLLLSQVGCATLGKVFCTEGTGLVYRDSDGFIDQIVPGSPAKTAGIPLYSTLISHHGGHLVIKLPTGEIKVYNLETVCLESVKAEKRNWQ